MSRSADRPAAALAALARAVVRGARLCIGIPDYATYCEHVRLAHPGSVPMDRAAFFRERMAARYGRGRSRCC